MSILYNVNMKQKLQLVFSLIFILSLGFMPLVGAQDSYNWTVAEDDVLVFDIEGMEGEDAVLLGNVALTIDTISGTQIDYSFTPTFSVDTDQYGNFRTAAAGLTDPPRPGS